VFGVTSRALLDEERCRKREGPHSRSGVTASLAWVDVPAGWGAL